jgi:hypothetical protein
VFENDYVVVFEFISCIHVYFIMLDMHLVNGIING